LQPVRCRLDEKNGMRANPDAYNDTLVLHLSTAIRHGPAQIKTIPGLVKEIIRREVWKGRYCELMREQVTLSSFRELIETEPLRGLGIELDLLKKLCQTVGDLEVLEMIETQVTGKHGGDHGNQYTGGKPDNVSLGNEQGYGNSPAYALRRLAKDRPDLHKKVLAKELTPNAAMIEAGFREKMFQCPTTVAKAASVLVRHFKPEEIQQLVSLLSTGTECAK